MGNAATTIVGDIDNNERKLQAAGPRARVLRELILRRLYREKREDIATYKIWPNHSPTFGIFRKLSHIVHHICRYLLLTPLFFLKYYWPTINWPLPVFLFFFGGAGGNSQGRQEYQIFVFTM